MTDERRHYAFFFAFKETYVFTSNEEKISDVFQWSLLGEIASPTSMEDFAHTFHAVRTGGTLGVFMLHDHEDVLGWRGALLAHRATRGG